jgi:GDPmannose 4,6-dehydratase
MASHRAFFASRCFPIGAENETGIVKSINKEVFHAIIQSCNHSIMHSSVSVGDTVISVDPNYYRPTEVDLLIGDPSKAKPCPPIFKAGKLDWQAETKLDELVKIMVESDFKKVVEKGY